MKIYTGNSEGATVVQNAFIDQYMPNANGEYVKVYLYLLRCANTGRDLSMSSIADVFDHTEKDIRRALAYWEKQHLLVIKTDTSDNPVAVTFCDFPSEAPSSSDIAPGTHSIKYTSNAAGSREREHTADAVDFAPASAPGTTKQQLSSAPDRDRFDEVCEQKEVRELFYIAERYFQRPLTSQEQSDFVYYYDNLKFSADLIEYLVEYSISKGCSSRHYMRKVALAWAEKGITTVLQAKQETNLYNKNYFTVMNAFGIKGRNPASVEQETMARWFDEFQFALDIVLEACRRTIRQTHQPNFQYADKILEQWHIQGVTSMTDIENLDHARQADPKKGQSRQAKSSGNNFQNFPQREYDFDKLERQLLNQ